VRYIVLTLDGPLVGGSAAELFLVVDTEARSAPSLPIRPRAIARCQTYDQAATVASEMNEGA